jgi:hypothetical protein
MKQITLFALLFLSLNALSQASLFERSHESPTFGGVDIYSDITKLKDAILLDKKNTLVSFGENKLVVRSNHFGVLSTLVFKANALSGVVYYFSRSFDDGKGYAMPPTESYDYQVEEVISRSGVKPYDQNSDPNEGEIYSKWLFSTGFLTVKLNHENKLIVQSERVYDQDVIEFANSLHIKK